MPLSSKTIATRFSRPKATRAFEMALVSLTAAVSLLLLPALSRAQSIQYTHNKPDQALRSSMRVDPSTLGLSIEVPIAGYPGRGETSLPINLSYSSKQWRIDFYDEWLSNGGLSRTESYPKFSEWAKAGWTTGMDLPAIEWTGHVQIYDVSGSPGCPNQSCQYVNRITIHMPGGASHELRVDDTPLTTLIYEGTYYAVDGSNMIYEAESFTDGVLYLPDGSRYILHHSNNNFQYIDRNGNTLSYNPTTRKWTDTQNRALDVPLPASPAATTYTYNLPSTSGTPATYNVRWSTLSNALTNPSDPLRYITNMTFGIGETYNSRSPALFDGDAENRLYAIDGGALFNPVVLAEIELPNGQSYLFTYNVWGEITKVVYPTGAYERFDYAPVASVGFLKPPYAQGNRGVVDRWLSPTGNSADEVHWHYAAAASDYVLTVSTTAPDNTVTQRLMSAETEEADNHKFGFSNVEIGLPFEERVFAPASAGGAMLRRTLTAWTSSGPTPGGYFEATRNPRAIKKVSILLDTGTSNALTSTTTMSYDDDLNVIATTHYGFTSIIQSSAQTSAIESITAGSALRTDEATYLVNDSSISSTIRATYRARNLLQLPTSTRVKNGSTLGPIVAQTRITYDEPGPYSLLTYEGTIIGWTDPSNEPRGLPTTTGVWLNTTGAYLQTHARYDQFGNVRTTWDANGNQSQITYSSEYSYAYPTTASTAIPDPTGVHGSTTALTTIAEYDADTGLITSLTDPNFHTTSFSYDSINRPATITRPSGGGSTSYLYGVTPGDLYVRTQTSIDATRVTEIYQYYDKLGRPCRTFLDEGSTYLTSDIQYDSMGRSWRTSNPYRTTSLTAAINPADDWTTNQYDYLGRVVSVTTSDGSVVTSAYSGSTSGALATVVTVTDQAGKLRRSLTDGLGRLARVDEPDASGNLGLVSSPAQPTTYSYDVLGNLLAVSQGSQSRSFVYNSVARLLSAVNPESGTTNYTYDNNGNLLTKTGARGIITTYGYDALNRNKTIVYSNDPETTPSVTRTYDGATHGKGRLWKTETVSGSRTTIGSYDALGRPTSQSQQFYWNNQWSDPFTVSATYSLSSQVLTLSYPSGHMASHSYDNADRTSSFAGDLGDGAPRTYSSEMIYSPFGGMAKEKFGTTTPIYNKLFYNSRGQLAEIRESTSYTGPTDMTWDRGAIINHYSNQAGCSGATCDATDNNGNLRRQQIFIPNTDPFLQSYYYDSLNRLQSVSENRNGGELNWQQTYTYDRYGNRRIDNNPIPPPGKTFGGVNNLSFELDLNTNRLLAPGDLALAEPSRRMRYDAAGNLKKDTYTGAGDRKYDAENRMIESAGSPAPSYSYDGDGRRVRRIIGTTETWQVYGIGGELLAEYAANSSDEAPQKEYGYRNGQLLITAAVSSSWGAPPTFTGPNPLVTGSQIKLENLTELRSAVNQLRQHAGLSAFNFTVDPSPQQNVTTVKADHIRQLRTALEQARLELGLSTGGYAHPTLTENSSLIYAIDFQELRNQILSAWNSGGGEEISWLVTDHLGTPRMVFDQTGSLANMKRHDYLPFGEELVIGGRETAPGYASDSIRQKFTSKERDSETGLDYFGPRYYSSTTGQFTSADSVAGSLWNPQSLNLYSYTLNNPVNLTDPTGHMAERPGAPRDSVDEIAWYDPNEFRKYCLCQNPTTTKPQAPPGYETMPDGTLTKPGGVVQESVTVKPKRGIFKRVFGGIGRLLGFGARRSGVVGHIAMEMIFPQPVGGGDADLGDSSTPWLTPKIQSTFLNGFHRQRLQQDTTFYRYFGPTPMIGPGVGYFSQQNFWSAEAARQMLALSDAVTGNMAQQVVEVTVPAGTIVAIGQARDQSPSDKYPGGGSQVVVENPRDPKIKYGTPRRMP